MQLVASSPGNNIDRNPVIPSVLRCVGETDPYLVNRLRRNREWVIHAAMTAGRCIRSVVGKARVTRRSPIYAGHRYASRRRIIIDDVYIRGNPGERSNKGESRPLSTNLHKRQLNDFFH